MKKKKKDEIEITNYIDDFDYDDDEKEEKEDATLEIEEEKEDEVEEENIEESINEDEDSDIDLEDTKEFVLPEEDEYDDPFSDTGVVSFEPEDNIPPKKEEPKKEKVKKPRKRYRLKKSAYILLGILVLIILVTTLSIKAYIKHKNWINSNEYKLLEKGYTNDEVKEILSSEDLTKMMLEREYNKEILTFIKEKYYLNKNLDKYLAYYEKNQSKTLSEIVTTINTGTDKDWYYKTVEADTTKGNLILVNKYFYLNEDFVPEDLTAISVKYAYNDKKVTKEVKEAYEKLASTALGNGFKLVAYQGYRSYDAQAKTYNNIKSSKRLSIADNTAARAGYSDYQTGLAIYVSGVKEDSEEYAWLSSNAHQFGFIIRFPKDKEKITGFGFDPAHIRYVGVEAATTIYNENLTLEEYYAYYVDGK